MTDVPSSDRIVVVGVDGSGGSAVALRWALDHADQLGRIEPVMTFVRGPFVPGFDASVENTDSYRLDAELRMQEFLESHAPSLVGSAVVIEHRPGAGLVKAAVSAELLVVGTRGLSGRSDLSVGSVGTYCANHSSVPVALIPHDVPDPHDHLDVVVGHDGSSHADDALRWTLTHLRRTARVTVLRVFTDESVIGEPLARTPGAAEASARAELDAAVSAVLDELGGHPSVDVSALPGDPRAVLRTAGAGADLVVVGSRGHGLLDRLLLGSVASALAHHPTVPTIVVPHRR